MRLPILARIATLIGAFAPLPALAGNPHATSQTAGAASATVALPVVLSATAPLQFGQFAQPGTSGTLTVTPFSTVSSTGGMTSAIQIAQTGGGRSPASFHVAGSPGQVFAVQAISNTSISNGSASMPVTSFSIAAATNGYVVGNYVIDPDGTFDLIVGATLNVSAGQAVGAYSGTFSLSVTYY